MLGHDPTSLPTTHINVWPNHWQKSCKRVFDPNTTDVSTLTPRPVQLEGRRPLGSAFCSPLRKAQRTQPLQSAEPSALPDGRASRTSLLPRRGFGYLKPDLLKSKYARPQLKNQGRAKPFARSQDASFVPIIFQKLCL